jgi:hypothetical protein
MHAIIWSRKWDMLFCNQIKSYEVEKYKTIPRVSCNYRSEWPTPTSSAAKTSAVRDVVAPPMQDPRKHHRQRGFVSRWTGPLHAARHMSLWHVDQGTSSCCLGPRFVASHRRSRRRMSNPPPPDQHPRSRRISSLQPPAPSRVTMNASDTPRKWSHQI